MGSVGIDNLNTRFDRQDVICLNHWLFDICEGVFSRAAAQVESGHWWDILYEWSKMIENSNVRCPHYLSKEPNLSSLPSKLTEPPYSIPLYERQCNDANRKAKTDKRASGSCGKLGQIPMEILISALLIVWWPINFRQKWLLTVEHRIYIIRTWFDIKAIRISCHEFRFHSFNNRRKKSSLPWSRAAYVQIWKSASSMSVPLRQRKV